LTFTSSKGSSNFYLKFSDELWERSSLESLYILAWKELVSSSQVLFLEKVISLSDDEFSYVLESIEGFKLSPGSEILLLTEILLKISLS